MGNQLYTCTLPARLPDGFFGRAIRLKVHMYMEMEGNILWLNKN